MHVVTVAIHYINIAIATQYMRKPQTILYTDSALRKSCVFLWWCAQLLLLCDCQWWSGYWIWIPLPSKCERSWYKLAMHFVLHFVQLLVCKISLCHGNESQLKWEIVAEWLCEILVCMFPLPNPNPSSLPSNTHVSTPLSTVVPLPGASCLFQVEMKTAF